MSLKLPLFLVALAVVFVNSASALSRSSSAPSPAEAKINALIAKMTLKEKVEMVSGDDPRTHGVKRLGIPEMVMNDGPLGVRIGHSTAFPVGLALGATFDPALASQMGAAIAEEANGKGVNMMLGPCVNIARQPFGGRNFESYGEDPFLNSVLGASYIRGMQSQGVIATVKHFAANDEEFHRKSMSSDMDMRTLFEIHLPAFKAAVDAGVWSVMSAYNRINGVYASQDPDLLTRILKTTWGFKGFVVSDWGAVQSTVATANAGLDLEMPTGLFYGAHLLKAVETKKVSMSVLDDKVRRLLRAMDAMGLLAPGQRTLKSAGPESVEHQQVAQKIAEEAVVLLKNENKILPLLDPHSIAVIGPHAGVLRTGGGGSSHVIPFHAVSPLEALRAELGSSTQINYADGVLFEGDPGVAMTAKDFKSGLRAEYFRTMRFTGRPFLIRNEEAVELSTDRALDDRFGVRLSGQLTASLTGDYIFSVMNSHSTRVMIAGKSVLSVEASGDSAISQVTLPLIAGKSYSFVLESGRGDDDTDVSLQMSWQLPVENRLAKAIAAAKASDVAVLFLGMGNDMETEGADRESLALPDDQLELLEAVVKVNPRTIVVLTGGGVITMPWLSKVKAVVQAWYPGQEGGHALARILTGKVNPSGKLPISFIKDWKDSSAYGFYPGTNDHVAYGEGVFVGYRFLDRVGKAPEFPFGFGLSYSTFALSRMQTGVVDSSTQSARVTVKFDVTNTSKTAGDEIAQVYVSEQNPSVPRPPRELKAFERVHLEPGQTKTVELALDASAFAFFDAPSMFWKVNPHNFDISLGTSSRDLPLHQSLKLH